MDQPYGETGNDTLNGDVGSDSLYGNAGHDTLTGNPGNDRLYGDAGNDVLNALDGFPFAFASVSEAARRDVDPASSARPRASTASSSPSVPDRSVMRRA